MSNIFSDFKSFSQRFEQEGHSYETILQELHTAWDAAHQEAIQQIENNEPLIAFADCFRYAMIATTIDSANSISLDDFTERANAFSVVASQSNEQVKRIIWQYMNSILPDIDSEFHVQYLMPFFAVVDDPQALKKHLYEAIDTVSDAYMRSGSQYILSHALSEPERTTLLQKALVTARQIVVLKMRGGGMNLVASALGDESIKQQVSDEIMGFVFDIEDAVSCVETGSFALELASPENYPAIVEKMLPLMATITKPRNYLEVAPLYLRFVDDATRQMLLQNIDKLLNELTVEYSFSAMVASAYDHFADYQQAKIRERILAMQHPSYRGRALGSINAAADPTLIKVVRHTLLDFLMSLRDADRAQLFFMMSLPNLVTPLVLGEDVFENITITCIEICRDWDVQSEE